MSGSRITYLAFGLILLSILGCTPAASTNPKKMTIKGKAVKGIATKTPVNKGTISLIAPGPKKWNRLVFGQGTDIPNIATVAADGTYTFTVEYSWFVELSFEPIYIAVTDQAQTYTLLSEVPSDLADADATLTVDTSPQTTMAGLWHCPHGVFQQPSYACPDGVTCQYPGGAPCYQDPEPSRTTADMVSAIDTAFIGQGLAEPDPTKLSTFSDQLLADAALFRKINDRLKALGYPEITDFRILSQQITAGSLPLIPIPTADDANDGTTPSTGGSSSGGCASTEVCSSSFSCSACSYRACSCSDGDSVLAYYKTGGGTKYACSSSGNCTSAAQSVLSACGCIRAVFTHPLEAMFGPMTAHH